MKDYSNDAAEVIWVLSHKIMKRPKSAPRSLYGASPSYKTQLHSGESISSSSSHPAWPRKTKRTAGIDSTCTCSIFKHNCLHTTLQYSDTWTDNWDDAFTVNICHSNSSIYIFYSLRNFFKSGLVIKGQVWWSSATYFYFFPKKLD